MSSPTTTINPPARTHAEAGFLLRRPFAPGAIGFRAMTKVAHNGEAYAGAQVVLPIGPKVRQVQAIRRQGKSDLLVLSADTEQWLRQGYETRMNTDAVKRDLGPILAHGEPETGMGQGEAAEQAATAPASAQEAPAPTGLSVVGAERGNGVVTVDFGGLGPAAPDAA